MPASLTTIAEPVMWGGRALLVEGGTEGFQLEGDLPQGCALVGIPRYVLGQLTRDRIVALGPAGVSHARIVATPPQARAWGLSWGVTLGETRLSLGCPRSCTEIRGRLKRMKLLWLGGVLGVTRSPGVLGLLGQLHSAITGHSPTNA